MEWVETTADTIEEAKNRALDQLGVAEDDAEFEILEEPKAGLFGRTRGEARVRARVRPHTPRSKEGQRRRQRGDGQRGDGQRGDKKPRSSGGDGARGEGRQSRGPRTGHNESGRSRSGGRQMSDEGTPREHTPVDPAEVSNAAVTFMNGLVAAFGRTGTVTAHREDDDIEVRVDGDELGTLVGPRGTTLLAIQDLARVASQRRLGDHDTRLRIDIAGYRERRREALSRFAQKVASEVVESGQARILEPMSSADRKIVHDALLEVEGVSTRSQGDDPQRRVVVEPA